MTGYVKRHIRKSQQERRQEILDAAMQIVSDHGMEGATVTRIAKAVGVTPGALYKHFESRSAILSEAHRIASERSADWVESSFEQDVLKRLEHVAGTHAAWAREHFNTVVRPLFMELAAVSDPEMVERLTLESVKSFRHIMDMAEEGKRKGQIRKDVPAEDVAWAVHMFAWTEDIATMAGEDQTGPDSSLRRNLKRMLDAFRAEDEPTPEI